MLTQAKFWLDSQKDHMADRGSSSGPLQSLCTMQVHYVLVTPADCWDQQDGWLTSEPPDSSGCVISLGFPRKVAEAPSNLLASPEPYNHRIVGSRFVS